MILQLTHYGQDILRKKTKRVSEFGEPLEEFIENMFETMYHADGIGLAANQVGVDMALATIDISHYDETIEPFVIINPEILESEGEGVKEEGCLSIPGIHEEVRRPSRVHVRYHTPDGALVEKEAEDLHARVIMHETDHLNGRFFVDKLSPVKRRFLKRKLNTIAREGFPSDEE